MRLIDADRLLKHTKFYNLKNGNRAIDEIDILHAQTVKAIPISDYATNGDIFKVMFPNVKILINENLGEQGTVFAIFKNPETVILFDLDWWNAPYKGVDE